MTLQLAYDVYQDRLLLTIGLDGAQAKGFWLTRRLTLLLWRTLVAQLAEMIDPLSPAQAREWLLSLQHEAATARHEATDQPQLPLLEAPALITTLQYGRQDDGRLVLSMRDTQRRGETYAMPTPFIHSLLLLIEQKAIQAEWNLDLAWPKTASIHSQPVTLQ